MLELVFNFVRSSILFSIVAVPIYILNNSAQGFPFFYIFPNTVISCLFNSSHFNRCEMISHCGFNLHFQDISDIEHDFVYLLAINMSSLEKCLFRSFDFYLIGLFSFFFFLLLSVWVLFIFWIINPLSDTWFSNIFSHLVDCIFTLLVVSFAVLKILVWCILFSLFHFCFCCLCFWCQIQVIIIKINLKSLLFFSRSFMVSSFIFRSLIHFEFIFVYGVNGLVSFFCKWLSSFLTSFPIVYTWVLLS